MRLSVRSAPTPPYAQMMERKTCQPQTPVPEKVCGFNPHSVHHLLRVAQLAERQIVALVVNGSSPFSQPNGTLAQQVERWIEDPCVPGPIPGGSTIMGEYPSLVKGSRL